jgi:hypothetical protein
LYGPAVIVWTAVKRRGKARQFLHITGMGASFILLLIAFYLDNGRNLPVWKSLPHYACCLFPSAAGIPIVVYALFKYRKL